MLDFAEVRMRGSERRLRHQPIRGVAWEVDRVGIRTGAWGYFRRRAGRRCWCLDRLSVRGGVGQGVRAHRIASDSVRPRKHSCFHGFGPDRRRARSPPPASAIGWELLAVAVLSGAVLFVLDRCAGHAREPGIARYLEPFSPNTITAILVAVAGVTVIAGACGGLYWLIPAVAASLIGGVVNAWQFLVRRPS
jgi:hypothetical protein